MNSMYENEQIERVGLHSILSFNRSSLVNFVLFKTDLLNIERIVQHGGNSNNY